MQTSFSPAQLADPQVAFSEAIVRKCVHCGFCTATCPTYVTLGNELDSPRGRIYLIKDMLENGRAADAQIVTHIDRCLSCLACTTTCPSGVDYMHLIDHARAHIQNTYQRPLIDRLIRNILAYVLPYPGRFRAAVSMAKFARPLAPLLERVQALRPLAAMLRLAPKTLPQKISFAPQNLIAKPLARVVILEGCAQPVLKPSINTAARALLTRLNIEIVTPVGEGCCGALVHHMGREHDSLAAARRNIDAWLAIEGGLDAIIITASGCGTTIKDYGHMLRLDPAYAAKAATVSALAKDATEFLATLELPAPSLKPSMRVAYHAACSLQHGQKITEAPKTLLKNAGFELVEPKESHLCCGSAGTYNIMQPGIAAKLLQRKLHNLKAVKPDLIAAGNIGCITQIGAAADIPVVHTIELLNWAYGGNQPDF
jgi:glycolate oxidase iron-sulfur subunit